MTDLNEIDKLNQEIPTTRENASKLLGEIKRKGGGIKDVRGLLAETITKKFGIDTREKSIDDLRQKLDKPTKNKDENLEAQENKKKEAEKKRDKEDKERNNIRKDKKQEKKEEAGEKLKKQKKDLVDQVNKDLGNDEKVKKILEDELNQIIEERDIKSNKQRKIELAKKIAEVKGEGNDTQIEMASKAMIEGVEKIEINNIEEVRKTRNENFRKEFEEEMVNLNPEIKGNEEQLGLVREQAKIIADVYYGEKGMENSRDDILNSGEISQGAYSDVEAIINLFQKSGKEIKEIKANYEIIKGKMAGLKMPDKFREFTSLDGVMGAMDSKLLDKFNFGQNRLFGWADRINKLTGGWLNRTFVNFTDKFVQKIGNEAVKVFAENALKTIAKEGFTRGVNLVIQSALSGLAKKGMAAGIKVGLQAGAKVAGGIFAKAGAAAAAGPYGWVAAVIILIVGLAKKLKKIFGNIAKKLGISFDIKDKLQRDYGKFGGWVLNKGYEGVKIAILPFIIIGAFFMLLFGQQQQASTLVTPTEEKNSDEEPSEPIGGIGESSDNIVCDPRTEDLGVYENAHYKGKSIKIRLCVVPNITTFRKAEVEIDPQQRRVVVVNSKVSGIFYQMAADALDDGVQLQAGYSFRTYEMQKEISIRNCGHIRGCSGVAGAGRSNHEAGLAIDFAKWMGKNSTINKWLVNNANKYSIYRIASEYWHWQVEQ